MCGPIRTTVNALRDAGLDPRVTWEILLGYVGSIDVYDGGRRVASVYVDHGRASVQRCDPRAAVRVHSAIAVANEDVAVA